MEEYFQELDFISLSDLINYINDINKTISILKTFKCSKNLDLQDFLHSENKAIYLENKHITRTYLFLEIINNQINIIAYFTITIKVLETQGLSKSLIKKLDGIDKHRNNLPCYLIAQLGKTDICQYKIGQYILDTAIETIKESHQIVGGRFIILDSVNIEKIIKFYTEEPNAFIQLDKSTDKIKSVRMYYPIL
jgi:hypothetical protein